MKVPEIDGGPPKSQALVPQGAADPLADPGRGKLRKPRRARKLSAADPLADPGRVRYPAYDTSAEYVGTDAAGLLVEYWNLIRRHKGAVLILGLAGMLVAILFTLPQTPIYQARTSLEIQGVNENFLNLKSMDPNSALPDYSGDAYIQTQMKILQSNALIGRVITALNTADSSQTAEAPHGWMTSLRTALHLPVARPKSARLAALASASSSLQVHNSNNTHIVEITCDSADPKLAADFANTLVREYIDHNLESRWKTSQHTGDWLKMQLQDLKIKLQQSETELQSYATEAGLMFTNEKSSVAEDKLRQLQQEMLKAQAERVLQQTKYENAASKPPETLPEILDDPMLREEQVKLVDLRRQFAESSSTLTPEHYKVQRIQAQISEVEASFEKSRAAVLSRIRNDFEAAQRREKLLMDDYIVQNQLVTQQSTRGIRYDILKREVDTNRQLYEALLQRVKEAGITAAMRASNISVVDPADQPPFPYKPKLMTTAGMGLIFGLILGVAMVIIRERADRSIQMPGEAPQYLNLLELGVIPAAKVEAGARLGRSRLPNLISSNNGHSNLSERVELVTCQRRLSMLAESFRAALASILFAWQQNKGCPVIVVTSAAPAEGKTMTASNLALAMAETHRKVLLIDADWRKPRIHDVFSVQNTDGLSDLLKRSEPLTEFVVQSAAQSTEIQGVDVITSGPGASSLSTLLYSARVPELFRIVRQIYDAVLIDTPPMLQMPDARILARHVDGVVLVLRAGRTSRDTAVLAKERFIDDGTPIFGTILNDWNAKTHSGYGYNGYYKGYYEYHGNNSDGHKAAT